MNDTDESPEENTVTKTEQSGKAEKNQQDTSEKATDDTPKEVGGQKGLEPTRYGDWEKNGIISDF